MTENQVSHPVLKGASVVVAWVGGMTWGDRASMLACGYTALLICDWWWKRFGKALAIRFGLKKGKPRAFMDSTSHGDLS